MTPGRPQFEFWGVLLVALACFSGALKSGDAVAARALFDYSRPTYFSGLEAVDAARMASQVRPWQAGFSECRKMRQQIVDARMSAFIAGKVE